MEGRISNKIKRISRVILRILIYFRLFPHKFFIFNPFKIYEFEELQRRIRFSRNDLILDIGCGNGLQTMLLGKRCKKVIGIDVSKKAVASAKIKSAFLNKKINSEIRCVKLENAEFGDEYFDKIFSICVIEHISNYVDILKEAYRILKRNGHMIFSVDALETIEDKKLIEKHRREHHVSKPIPGLKTGALGNKDEMFFIYQKGFNVAAKIKRYISKLDKL